MRQHKSHIAIPGQFSARHIVVILCQLHHASTVQTTVYIEKLLKHISGQMNAVFRNQIGYQLRGLHTIY